MELNKENIKKILLIISVTILFYTCLQNIKSVIDISLNFIAYFSPLITGGIIAFILNVPMNFIEHSFLGFKNLAEKDTQKKSVLEKIVRPLSLIITVILIFGIVLLVVLIIAPELSRTFGVIISTIQNVINNDNSEWLNKLFDKYPQVKNYLENINIDWEGLGRKVVEFLKNGIGDMLSSTISTVGSVINGVLNAVLGFVFAIYILVSKERIGRQGKQIVYAVFSEKHADSIINFFKLANVQFSNFVTGQCLDALIIGTLFFIFMILFGFKYSLLISVFIGFTAIIPVFGSTIGCVFGAFILLIDNPVRVIGFLILFFAIQQIDESLIYPKVVGSSVGLPPIWALAAVIVGGSMMGVLGMLLFIPIGSIMYTLISKWTKKRLVLKHVDNNKWERTSIVLSPGQLEFLKKRRKAIRNSISNKANNRKINRKKVNKEVSKGNKAKNN